LLRVASLNYSDCDCCPGNLIVRYDRNGGFAYFNVKFLGLKGGEVKSVMFHECNQFGALVSSARNSGWIHDGLGEKTLGQLARDFANSKLGLSWEEAA